MFHHRQKEKLPSTSTFKSKVCLMLHPFQLCCSLNGGFSCQLSGGKAWWIPTPITASNTTHVELYAGVCGADQNILGLRYAWRLTPCQLKQCAIYSKQNALPAPPFVAYPPGLSSGETSSFALNWRKPVRIQ